MCVCVCVCVCVWSLITLHKFEAEVYQWKFIVLSLFSYYLFI